MNSSPQEADHTDGQEALDLFRQCTPLFDALGDPMRQNIILLLGDHEHLNVNGIAERLPLSRPAISHHLKILREAGFVDCEKRGVWAYYWATDEGKRSLSLVKSLL